MYNTQMANAQPSFGQQLLSAAITPPGAPGGLFGTGGIGGGPVTVNNAGSINQAISPYDTYIQAANAGGNAAKGFAAAGGV